MVKHALFGMLLTASAALAQPLPVLHFDPPKGFTGSLGKAPSAHVSMSGDAMLNVAGADLQVDSLTFKKSALKK